VHNNLPTSSDGVKDTSLKTKAKTKDFKIVLEDPRELQHCQPDTK